MVPVVNITNKNSGHKDEPVLTHSHAYIAHNNFILFSFTFNILDLTSLTDN